MSYVITDSQNYTDIANAIRGKNGSADTYTPAQMATAITNIPSGGTVPTVSSNMYPYIFYSGINWPLYNCYDFTSTNVLINDLSGTFMNFNRRDVTTIDISNWRYNSNSVSFVGTFESCRFLSLTDSIYHPYKIIFPESIKVNAERMFMDSLLHKETNLNSLIITNAQEMFRSTNSITGSLNVDSNTTVRHLNLSDCDISDCYSLYGMFYQYGLSFDDGNSVKIKLNTNLSGTYNISYLCYSANTLTTLWLGDDNTTWHISQGTYVFNGCTKLKHVVIRGTNVMNVTGSNAFTNSTLVSGGTGFIYVPDALVEDYKAATYWKSRTSQIKPISEYVEEDD